MRRGERELQTASAIDLAAKIHDICTSLVRDALQITAKELIKIIDEMLIPFATCDTIEQNLFKRSQLVVVLSSKREVHSQMHPMLKLLFRNEEID
jgi:hypothetical protein